MTIDPKNRRILDMICQNRGICRSDYLADRILADYQKFPKEERERIAEKSVI